MYLLISSLESVLISATSVLAHGKFVLNQVHRPKITVKSTNFHNRKQCEARKIRQHTNSMLESKFGR